MLVGIMGSMGTGKTLTMVMLMQYLHMSAKAKLGGNFSLIGAQRINRSSQLWQFDDGVFGFDEMWISMDSRASSSKVNRFISQWVNQSRKKKLVFFYTTQHIRQLDVRVRNATDILIVLEKNHETFILTFVDFQYRKILRRIKIDERFLRPFYAMYDTYEIIMPLEIDGYAPGEE